MRGAQTFDADEPQGSDLLASFPTILWERRWWLILPLFLGSIAGSAAAVFLPPTYQSRAAMVVESQTLPGELGENPMGEVIDRRIARIRQQLLSRPDLVQIIQSNNLYNAAARNQPLSVLVERMREATTLQAVDARIGTGGGGRASGSIAFELIFEYSEAAPAQLVAQTFVDKLLQLDASDSQAQARDNVRLLEDQQGSLQEQITALESEVNRITGQEGTALANAGGGPVVIGGSAGYETQIASIQRDNAQLSAQLDQRRDSGVAQAEAQLAAAKAIYADDHPDVKLAETRLQAARQIASASGGNARTDQAIRAQIATNNALIQQVAQARAAEQGRAAQIMAAQARGPVVAQRVSQLQARIDALRGNMSRVNSSLVNAESLQKLATEQRGERLLLIDPPVTPDEPTKPNRVALVIGGIAGGGALGIGLVLLIELLASPIRSVDALARLTGAAPLGVVPTLRLGRHAYVAHRKKEGWLRKLMLAPFRAITWPFRKVVGFFARRRHTTA